MDPETDEPYDKFARAAARASAWARGRIEAGAVTADMRASALDRQFEANLVETRAIVEAKGRRTPAQRDSVRRVICGDVKDCPP
jgi:hypothetical protein